MEAAPWSILKGLTALVLRLQPSEVVQGHSFSMLSLKDNNQLVKNQRQGAKTWFLQSKFQLLQAALRVTQE